MFRRSISLSLAATVLFGGSALAQQPLQWRYSFDADGVATATYPGNVANTGDIVVTNGGRIDIFNNRKQDVLGDADGIKVSISSYQSTSNPALGDDVAIYPHISSEAGRNRVWAINPIVDVVAGNEATAWAIEGNMNVATANAPDPFNTNHKIGIDMVSGGPFAPSAAYTAYSSTLENRWKHGVWLANIGGQAGSSLIKTGVNVSVDYGLDLSTATINNQGVRVGATTPGQVASIGAKQLANGQVAFFGQRFTDSGPTGNLLTFVNADNTVVLANIDVNGNATFGSIAAAGPVDLHAYTVATLPVCNAGLQGGFAHVTDATSPTYNGALTGGGAVFVPVFCNGTAWTSH